GQVEVRASQPVGDPRAQRRAPGTTDNLQVRVEWPNVPVAARTSPGRTPCNTPRAPLVAPTTTWGVPDALVIVDGAPPADPPPAPHVTLADCALAPRVIAGGPTLAITSAADRPAALALRKHGLATDLAHLTPGAPTAIQLPIAGHTVTTALDAGAIYALATDASEPELAYIAALPGAAVTEASGQVTLRHLAVGAHAVTAWLPPRAGQPARLGRATAKVSAGELAEVTVSFAP
ncbi:MAG TPA: hypothetical protein VFP84_13120, partial [Kofleriaceae bacterium]|nr:hypothetical protein [Kofleriaceae bacterium]